MQWSKRSGRAAQYDQKCIAVSILLCCVATTLVATALVCLHDVSMIATGVEGADQGEEEPSHHHVAPEMSLPHKPSQFLIHPSPTPRMPSPLLALPNEPILMVLENLPPLKDWSVRRRDPGGLLQRRSGSSELFALARTSVRMNQFAEPLLYRDIFITPDDVAKIKRLLLTLVKGQGLAKCVRTCTVGISGPTSLPPRNQKPRASSLLNFLLTESLSIKQDFWHQMSGIQAAIDKPRPDLTYTKKIVWLQHLRTSSDTALALALALILSLCTNLTHIAMVPKYMNFQSYTGPMFGMYEPGLRDVDLSQAQLRAQAFPKLEKLVTVAGSDETSHRMNGIDFVLQESLISLRISDGHRLGRILPPSPGLENLHQFKLKRIYVEPKKLETILRGSACSRLESLKICWINITRQEDNHSKGYDLPTLIRIIENNLTEPK
jgi:hypothetical protein